MPKENSTLPTGVANASKGTNLVTRVSEPSSWRRSHLGFGKSQVWPQIARDFFRNEPGPIQQLSLQKVMTLGDKKHLWDKTVKKYSLRDTPYEDMVRLLPEPRSLHLGSKNSHLMAAQVSHCSACATAVMIGFPYIIMAAVCLREPPPARVSQLRHARGWVAEVSTRFILVIIVLQRNSGMFVVASDEIRNATLITARVAAFG